MRKLLFILKMWGTANWYQGIDKPTLWQFIYKWRMSLKTSIEVAKIIYDKA